MDSQPKVVLVVEDEWLIRESLVEVLAQAGFRVLQAAHGEDALATMQEHGPAIDLLFTDIRMPGRLDGLELARRARALLPGLAILIASGNWVPTPGDLPAGSFFLAKPYSFRELPGQLRTFLDTGQTRA